MAYPTARPARSGWYDSRTVSTLQATGIAFAAVLSGVYFGVTTINEIDPFYRNRPVAEKQSSYTTAGWRGADATQAATASVTIESRYDRFVGAMISTNPAIFAPGTDRAPAGLGSEPVAAYSGGWRDDEMTASLDSGRDEPAPGAWQCIGCSSESNRADSGVGIDQDESECGGDGNCVAESDGATDPAWLDSGDHLTLAQGSR